MYRWKNCEKYLCCFVSFSLSYESNKIKTCALDVDKLANARKARRGCLTSLSCLPFQTGMGNPISLSYLLSRPAAEASCLFRLVTTIVLLLVNSSSASPKGGRGCLMSHSCLESQGCHLIPLPYFLSCFVFFLPRPLALSVLAFFC